MNKREEITKFKENDSVESPIVVQLKMERNAEI